MSRRGLKPQPVGDAIDHKASGMTVQMMLDRNTLEFFADVNGDVFREKTADALRPKIIQALDGSAQLAWHPVILVHTSYDRFRDIEHSVSMRIERFWWARTPSGKLLRTHENDLDDDGKDGNTFGADSDAGRLKRAGHFYVREEDERRSGFAPPCYADDSHGEAGWFLPYTDDVWAALRSIQGVIASARQAIKALLGDYDKLHALAHAKVPVQLMLHAAADTTTTKEP